VHPAEPSSRPRCKATEDPYWKCGIRRKRFRGKVSALKLRNQRSALEIDPETTIPLWEGERMDDGMAVEGLLQLE